MKNSVTVLLIIAVGILGLIAYRQAIALRHQRQQGLTANASLELQEKCAKQAREYLSQFENKNLVDTQNHYNVGLNKCFVETHSESLELGNRVESKVLTDAFEGKDYGTFIFISKPNQADYLVPPVECKVMLPSKGETICKSSDEFDALVNQYME